MMWDWLNERLERIHWTAWVTALAVYSFAETLNIPAHMWAK